MCDLFSHSNLTRRLQYFTVGKGDRHSAAGERVTHVVGVADDQCSTVMHWLSRHRFVLYSADVAFLDGGRKCLVQRLRNLRSHGVQHILLQFSVRLIGQFVAGEVNQATDLIGADGVKEHRRRLAQNDMSVFGIRQFAVFHDDAEEEGGAFDRWIHKCTAQGRVHAIADDGEMCPRDMIGSTCAITHATDSVIVGKVLSIDVDQRLDDALSHRHTFFLRRQLAEALNEATCSTLDTNVTSRNGQTVMETPPRHDLASLVLRVLQLVLFAILE